MEEFNLLIFILILYGLINIFIGSYLFFTDYQGTNYCYTPKQIRQVTNLNLFGSTLVWLLQLILCPLIYILRFFYWLLHYKRST